MKPEPEFIQLVDQCLAQEISKADMKKLEQYLLNKNDCLSYYLEMTEIEGALPFLIADSLTNSEQDDASNVISMNGQKYDASAKKHFLKIAAAVAIFALGIGAGTMLQNNTNQSTIASKPSDEKNSGSVINDTKPDATNALITSMVGVTWDETPPSSLALSSSSESVQIKSGLLELTFASGVKTLIEGPARIKISGDNQAYLYSGRLVADVPRGAEGFTVNYQEGKVVDLGTEFALNVPENQKNVEVGVFRGEVEVYKKGDTTARKITENHALMQQHTEPSGFVSIPFQHQEYIRNLPTSEFPWSVVQQLGKKQILEFDVSHLIWRNGEYKAIMKYMQGSNTLALHKAELLHNGTVIDTDEHLGRIGGIFDIEKNIFQFRIPESNYSKGRWVLRITTELEGRAISHNNLAKDEHHETTGVLLFEDRQVSRAVENDFIGAWEFYHDGNTHQRIFTPDHKAVYKLNGERTHNFNHATWEVENGVLTLTIPATLGETKEQKERHLIRNGKELIFINRPYRNGKKVHSR